MLKDFKTQLLWIAAFCLLFFQAAWAQQAAYDDDRGEAVWQQENPEVPSDIRLQTQKLGAPNVVLFRQLQQKRYNDYDIKTKSLRNSLTNAHLYILAQHGAMPDLQRISALAADSWQKWQTLDQNLNDDERKYRSYQAMKTACVELKALSEYWINANAIRPVYRGTQKDMDIDQAVIKQKEAKIDSTLNALSDLEEIKRSLDDELPSD